MLFRGDWHLEQVGFGPVLRMHLCTCTPQATSSASRRARKGDVDYAWMVWSAPLSLACFEDTAVYSVGCSVVFVWLYFDQLSEAGVEIGESVFGVVVCIRVFSVRPRS